MLSFLALREPVPPFPTPYADRDTMGGGWAIRGWVEVRLHCVAIHGQTMWHGNELPIERWCSGRGFAGTSTCRRSESTDAGGIGDVDNLFYNW